MNYVSRQEKIRDILNELNNKLIIQSTIRMFPGELKRFRAEFPRLSFVIQATSETPNSKLHTVFVKRKH